MRKSRPEVHREVRRAVKAAAELVAEDARRKASWSTRIPGTVKASVLGNGTAASVRAGGAKAPHAKALENAGRDGMFRHPVFPDQSKTRSEWTWVSQQARPFLHPALLDRFPETVRAIGAAVTVAVDRVTGRV